MRSILYISLNNVMGRDSAVPSVGKNKKWFKIIVCKIFYIFYKYLIYSIFIFIIDNVNWTPKV